MGEPGAFSSGGWHVPKSGQSFESPATPLTNYCCCCSETKKKKKKGWENQMEKPAQAPAGGSPWAGAQQREN